MAKQGNMINSEVRTDSSGFCISQSALSECRSLKFEGITSTGYKIQVYWRYFNANWTPATDTDGSNLIIEADTKFTLSKTDAGTTWGLKLLNSSDVAVADTLISSIGALSNLNAGFKGA